MSYREEAAEQAARTDQRQWLDRLVQERANIRLAFERLLRAGATDEAVRVAIAFARALPRGRACVRGLRVALALYGAAGELYGAGERWPTWGGVPRPRRLEEFERRLGQARELHRRHRGDSRLVEPLIDHACLMLAHHRGQEATQGCLDSFSLARRVCDEFNVGEALTGLSTHAARDARGGPRAALRSIRRRHEHIDAPPRESVAEIQERALADGRSALGRLRYPARLPRVAVGPPRTRSRSPRAGRRGGRHRFPPTAPAR